MEVLLVSPNDIMLRAIIMYFKKTRSRRGATVTTSLRFPLNFYFQPDVTSILPSFTRRNVNCEIITMENLLLNWQGIAITCITYERAAVALGQITRESRYLWDAKKSAFHVNHIRGEITESLARHVSHLLRYAIYCIKMH